MVVVVAHRKGHGYWHFLAQSPSVEILSPSPATVLEMLVGISEHHH
jgi:hypothetical protein